LIMENDTREAYFDGIVLSMTLKQAKTASHPGQCDEDVAFVAAQLDDQLDQIGPALLRDVLKEWGYEKEVLVDHEDNLLTLVWLAAGQIVDEEGQSS